MQWKVLVEKRQENHGKMAQFWDFYETLERMEGVFPDFHREPKKQKLYT